MEGGAATIGNGSSSSRNEAQQLKFSLTISDATDIVTVIFEGAHAEAYLGVSVAEFGDNAEVQQRVLKMLESCREQEVVCEFKFRVFVSKEAVPLESGERSGAPSSLTTSVPAPQSKRSKRDKKKKNKKNLPPPVEVLAVVR
jgi:hypothetical protein